MFSFLFLLFLQAGSRWAPIFEARVVRAVRAARVVGGLVNYAYKKSSYILYRTITNFNQAGTTLPTLSKTRG